MSDKLGIVSRSEAKKIGLKSYFTGKPCINGHVSKRTTSSGSCHACLHERRKVWLENGGREKLNEWKRRNSRERYKNDDSFRAKVKKRNDEWARKNTDKLTEKSRRYRKRNPHKIKEWNEKRRLRHAYRYKNDPHYKISVLMRGRIKKVLERGRISKKTSDILGCDRDQFIRYIEGMFKEGMNWDNWSVHGWHLDHIIPINSFDLTKDEDFKKAFHYTNLQPLWAEENLKKSDKIVW